MAHEIMSLHEGDEASSIDDFSLYIKVLEKTSAAKYWGITVTSDIEQGQNY